MSRLVTEALFTNAGGNLVLLVGSPSLATGAALSTTLFALPVWSIYRYASLRVIKIAAQINQNWYVYQKYRYLG